MTLSRTPDSRPVRTRRRSTEVRFSSHFLYLQRLKYSHRLHLTEELSEKLPINRAGAPSLKVQPAPLLAKRPAEKKQDKAPKKGEKRKKGDKGHSAYTFSPFGISI